VKQIFDEKGIAVELGNASTGAEALRLADEQDWDIAVMDISLGKGRSGLEVLKEIRKLKPKLPVLMFSMHSDEVYARRAINAGAQGYITKGSSSEELFEAVNSVLAGGRFITPDLAEKIIFASPSAELPHDRLSEMERKVMLMIAAGMRNKEIAAELHIDSSTVTTHRRRLLDKMDMNTDAEINRYAREHKLLN
jgi:DNA-binding NarL/FixJ family response regulator